VRERAIERVRERKSKHDDIDEGKKELDENRRGAEYMSERNEEMKRKAGRQKRSRSSLGYRSPK
jgi:hypothetical protein